jgi:Na+/proline symporter
MGMVIFTLVIGIYTMVAGYWGVVVGDLQQGTIMFLLIVFVAAYGIAGAGGVEGIRTSLAAMGESWRLNPFHFDAFNATDPNNFSLFWLITMIIILVFGGLGMGTHIDYYPDAQRAASTKSIRDASYSIWGGGMLIIIRNSIWVAMVLAFFVLLPALSMGNPTSGYDMSFYWIGFKFLPAGLVGFFFAGILAVHISTIDTHINLGAEYATRDIYHHYINPNATEKQLVRVGRIATILIMLGSFVFGLMVGEDFVGWLIFAMWFLSSAIWLPQLLQVLWWRFNGWGYLTAMIVNLGVSWLIAWVLPALGVIPVYNDAVRFWLMMIISAIIYLPATLLTKPEDMDHLVMFYTMTRPPGFWGPVRKEAVRRGLIKE